MAPEVGTEAPDFTVKDQNNQAVTLSSFRGERAVLLVFYPFAFSGICTSELGAVRDDLADFQNDDVQILAISTDHPYALKAWSESQGFDFPLLSDFWPHGEVAQGVRGVPREARHGRARDVPRRQGGDRAVRRGQRAGRGARPEQLAQGGGSPGCLRYPRAEARARARSSAGEHSAYTRAVAGSNPAAPTSLTRRFARL